jgi:hypothetical protein
MRSQRVAFGMLMICVIVTVAHAQEKRLIQPSDCVGVRYLNNDLLQNPIQINVQGTRAAYLVQAANLAQNQDEVELSVIDINRDPNRKGKVVLTDSSISHIVWLEDGKHLTLLANFSGHVSVVRLDVTNGEKEVLASSNQDIVEYTIDRRGNTIVFATEEPLGNMNTPVTSEENAKGYRIPFHRAEGTPAPKRKLYLTRRLDHGSWSEPELIIIQSPTTKQSMLVFSHAPGLPLRLSLSPNGRFLLISYIETQISEDLKKIPSVQLNVVAGLVSITAMTDLISGVTTLPLKTIWTSSVPLWSPDGQSFVAVAKSPVNSEWEANDVRNHLTSYNATHLFWVEPATGKVEQVAVHVANMLDSALAWTSNQILLVHTSHDIVTRFSHAGSEWKPTASFQIPLPHFPRNAALASDGRVIVGDYETPTFPPELFLYEIGQNSASVLAKLDPQFDNLMIAPEEKVHWKTSTGYSIDGILLLPPGYKRGNRYPLVIQANQGLDTFACDSGSEHEPSQAPQPIADEGILYLMRSYPEDYKIQDEVSHWPKGYPDGIGEAAFEMDVWDSAVDFLDKRGMIDRDRVGIIGFSRKGWATEFSLVHGKTRYRAATTTDNVSYTFGEYWLGLGVVSSGYDVMYGGAPYGAGLRNWLDYSVSFNLDKFRTPLLMEEMGYDIPYDNFSAPPKSLSLKFEIFNGLNRLKKPVEMYYYPYEEHLPRHPLARLASVQRNVDWYQFWLQGYERPNPEDPGQYLRWHKLRDLQQQVDNSSGSGTTEGKAIAVP